MAGADNRRSGPAVFGQMLVVAGTVGLLGLAVLATNAAAIHSHPAHGSPQAHTAGEVVLASYKGRWGRQLVVEMNGQKLSLFVFSKDSPGKSTCYGKCSKIWYPLLDHGRIVTEGRGVRRQALKTFKRRDGSLQIEDYGQPLYRCYRNTKTGQDDGTNEYAFGGSWGLEGAAGGPVPPDAYGGKPPPNC